MGAHPLHSVVDGELSPSGTLSATQAVLVTIVCTTFVGLVSIKKFTATSSTESVMPMIGNWFWQIVVAIFVTAAAVSGNVAASFAAEG